MKIWLTFIVLGATLTGCAVPDTGINSALTPGARYVAMGSSYAAGAGITPFKSGGPVRCGQSSLSYATLLAARLNLELVDASCGGATTEHILGSWKELPPQIDAVTPETRLVTITIGGNDVSFVTNLMIGSCTVTAPGSSTCPPLRSVTEADWTKLENNFREIARQVHKRAPLAKLVFVDYVSIMPQGKPCVAVPLAGANADFLRQTAKRLADINVKVAREEGALLIKAGVLTRSHTPCDPDPWSAGAPGTAKGAPWHPLAAAHAAIADALSKKLTF